MQSKLDFRYFYPQVFQVLPTDDYKVYAYFNSGAVKLADIKPLIEKGGVFAPLRDINFFKSACSVINYTVAWDMSGGKRDEQTCLDLDPMVLFELPDVDDPLE